VSWLLLSPSLVSDNGPRAPLEVVVRRVTPDRVTPCARGWRRSSTRRSATPRDR